MDYRGIKGSGQSQHLKEYTAHGPDIGLEVVLNPLAKLRGHVVWCSYTLENCFH